MHTQSRFGPYEIVEEIGHGGMGRVYRARDSRLNREVALKIVADNFLSDGTPTVASHDRFMREARASSALNHPNICTIYDVGEQAGQPYLVMELLEGCTLKELINGMPMPVDQVLDYGIQLCAALAEAHGHGILHRDIKPSNLFVTRREQGNGVLKVLDFGIAKRTNFASSASDTVDDLLHGAAETGTLTGDGTTLGTIAYMSPEQARGEAVDARADVFSAGVVLYEMATGASPFYGSSMAEIFAALLTRDAEPIRGSQPRFPRELERVIFKALARERERRYASAADLRADLLQIQSALAGSTSTLRLTRGIAVAAEFRQPGQRRPAKWLAASCGVVLVALGGWTVYSWQSHRPVAKVAQPDHVVVSEFSNLTGDSSFDGTLRQALSFELGRSPQLAVVGDARLRDMLAYLELPPDGHVTPAVAREIAERAGDPAVVNGNISALGSDYLVTLEAQRAGSGEIFARAQAQADSKGHVLRALRSAAAELRAHMEESLGAEPASASDVKAATTASGEAFRAYAAGERDLARANFSQSIRQYQRAVELDPDFAMAYARLGVAQVAIGSPTEGDAAIEHAFSLSGRASERERLYIRIQYALDVTGDLPEAIDALRLYGQNYPQEPLAANDLSVAYLTLGKYAEAYRQAQRAIAMNPQKGSGYVNALLALNALDRFGEAKALYGKATSLGLADDGSIRGTWIFTAWLTGDRVEVERQREWARDRTDGFLVNAQSGLLNEMEGRFARAGEEWQRAIRQLEQQGMQNATATMMAQRTLDAALAGDCEGSAKALKLAMSRDRDRFMQGTAATAYALCGDAAKAQAIEDGLEKNYPRDTLINHVYLPEIAAAIAIERHRPDAALRALGAAEGYETLGLSSYLRGLAHLDLKQSAEAETAFRIPLANRSAYVLSQQPGMNVALPLSVLGLARAEAQAGEKTAAGKDYAAFLDAWKNADPSLKPLTAARTESAAAAR